MDEQEERWHVFKASFTGHPVQWNGVLAADWRVLEPWERADLEQAIREGTPYKDVLYVSPRRVQA